MISGRILKQHGWPEGKVIGVAKATAERLERQGMSQEDTLARLDRVRAQPGEFLADTACADLARECLRHESKAVSVANDALRDAPLEYPVWGRDQIDPGAIGQMDQAMRLPVSRAGALMPDAHIGYGLPIGGVLATENAVIPYAVGVDIACFPGDARVALLNGQSKTLVELADADEQVTVYTCTPSGRVKAAAARAVKTRAAAALVRVTLDTGAEIRCTPDHEFMLRDGSFRQAACLAPGASLMPLYRDVDRHGYTLVQQNYSGRWQKAHWVVARSGLLGTVPRFASQKTVVHHRDFNERNNDPANLQFMGDKDHARYHRQLVERNTHWQSRDFERRRVDALAAKAKTPEGHAYYAARGTRNIREALKNKRDAMIPNWEAAGQRGREHLIRRNQSPAGRAKSKEMANALYPCETCGEGVKSYIGLHNHRRLIHGYNHTVLSVEPRTEQEDVYCLIVPGHGNFALEAGVFVHNCRMRLSIYKVTPTVLDQKRKQFERSLLDHTYFGAGASSAGKGRAIEHPVLDDRAWSGTRLLRTLQQTAARQIGTSGTGNHFVEWGAVRIASDEAGRSLGLASGDYLALLSHSGSRAVGFKIANLYSKLATELHPDLDQKVRHLAWLGLETEPGQEYWLSMELAGRFASANHAVIHRQVSAAVGLDEAAAVENHHNFAWRERLPGSGRDVIVHRKGATPAGEGVLGVVPGSMGDSGYVVRGRGVGSSLNSASHGAGRALSRRAAMERITKTARDAYLRERGVTLLGGGLDEAPQAYKRIELVLAAQSDLVDVVAMFTPRLVRMADEPGDT